MITGNLQQKKGYYYAILNIKDENGKTKQKWIATGLPVKGNKKKAEEILLTLRYEYNEKANSAKTGDAAMLFPDFLKKWLDETKHTIQDTTYNSYQNHIDARLVVHFKGIKLCDVTPENIEALYRQIQDEGFTGNTAIHYHAVINKALKHAVKKGILSVNPVDRVSRPKKGKYIAKYYNVSELETLLNIVEEDSLYIVVTLAANYGFRRSEVLGVRWDSIDFENKTIAITHKVYEAKVGGKYVPVIKGLLKNDSSYRTMPLFPHVEEILLRHKDVDSGNQQKMEYACPGLGYDNWATRGLFSRQAGHPAGGMTLGRCPKPRSISLWFSPGQGNGRRPAVRPGAKPSAALGSVSTVALSSAQVKAILLYPCHWSIIPFTHLPRHSPKKARSAHSR